MGSRETATALSSLEKIDGSSNRHCAVSIINGAQPEDVEKRQMLLEDEKEKETVAKVKNGNKSIIKNHSYITNESKALDKCGWEKYDEMTMNGT